jgi:predicted nucleic acid-binding protein
VWYNGNITGGSMRIYLDNCCFNRPYDDQSQKTIRRETVAKLDIQSRIYAGEIELVWSYILEYENSLNKNLEKKNAILKWKSLAIIDINETPMIIELSKVIMKTGIHLKDAIHLASAIEASADFFITVDKRVLKFNDERIKICNPVEFAELLEGKR